MWRFTRGHFRIRRIIYIILQVCFLFFILTANLFAYDDKLEDSNRINSNLYGFTVISGIVEDNNPALGYITVYNPSIMEQGIQIKEREDMLQTYNYINPDNIEVLKNHKKATLESIEEGDTVFIRLDSDGYIVSISGVSNYIVKYAKVLYKTADTLIVEYQEEKYQEILKINKDVAVFVNGILTDLSDLKDGDRIKLLLSKTSESTNIKEIIIEEGERHFISNVYKGFISYMNDISNRIIVGNLLVFDRGRWVRAGVKGFTSFELAEEYSIFYNGREADISLAGFLLRSKEAYIAVGKDYGGSEHVKFISVRNSKEAEIIYNDTVAKHISGSGRLTIDRELKNILYGRESIIIKDGRLVQGNSISEEDTVYIVANRSNSGDLMAGIIQVYYKPVLDNLEIYRARIKSINDNVDFTVESFSRLNGVNWEYNNTPKTFNITFDTRVLDEEGLINQDDFTGYGEDSFINRVVYIVADGLDAKVISTAPYGIYNIRGEIYNIGGGVVGGEGTIIEEPDEIHLVKTKTYDVSQRKWVDSGEMNLRILKNSLILKNDKEIKPSALKNGDKVRIIKKDKAGTGDAYVIIVEE
ncbi:MAG: hypothetical protein HPY74_13430 [Firmicutes bacterium]|nr:hypothetical protein [Bacillota bacterium]